MKLNDLPSWVSDKVNSILCDYWGMDSSSFDWDEEDEYYSQSGMRYGYVAISSKFHMITIDVCDSTPDDGDTIIERIWMEK